MDNIIKKTYITELDRSILIYGSITCLDETNSSDEVDLISPHKKIRFKNQITLEAARVKDDEIIKVANNKMQNFGILLTKIDKRIGKKKAEISYPLIDTFHIKALQNLEEYNKLNPIDIRLIQVK